MTRLFARLEQQDVALARIEERLKALPCDRHTTTLDGNGKDGLRVRVDRLEQRDRSRAKAQWIVFGAAVAGAISFFLEVLKLVR